MDSPRAHNWAFAAPSCVGSGYEPPDQAVDSDGCEKSRQALLRTGRSRSTAACTASSMRSRSAWASRSAASLISAVSFHQCVETCCDPRTPRRHATRTAPYWASAAVVVWRYSATSAGVASAGSWSDIADDDRKREGGRFRDLGPTDLASSPPAPAGFVAPAPSGYCCVLYLDGIAGIVGGLVSGVVCVVARGGLTHAPTLSFLVAVTS
jgi:hypothetical protein